MEPIVVQKFLAKTTNTHKQTQTAVCMGQAALLVHMKPQRVQDLHTSCTSKKFHNSMVSVSGLSYHWKTVCIRIKVTAKSNYNTFFQHFSSLRLLQSSGKNKLISTTCLVIIQWYTRAKVISQFGYIHAFSYTDPYGGKSPNSPLASLPVILWKTYMGSVSHHFCMWHQPVSTTRLQTTEVLVFSQISAT